METTVIAPAAMGLFLSVTNGQFGGIVFGVGPADCPRLVNGEEQATFEHNFASGPMCAELGTVCPNGNCSISLSANLIDTNSLPPSEIGACSDFDCNNCDITDIDEAGGSAFRHNCQHDGQHYIYMAGSP